MKMTKLKTLLLSSLSAFFLAEMSQAQTLQVNSPSAVPANGATSGIAVSNSEFSIFTPQQQTHSKSIDYSVLDAILSNVVVDLGPSTRIFQRRPDPELGTRIVNGHTSPYRLEGKRIMFSFLDNDFKSGVSDYRKDLQEVGSKIDLTRFSRDEQLAYWLNLHNVAVIEQIALNYPAKSPRKIKIDVNGNKVDFHNAKFMTVKGVSLSLRDIREKIVYPNWDDPEIIYGFFHGDIGSPSVQEYAFTPDRFDFIFSSNAEEFVNSLRGVRETSKGISISEIYENEGRFYFKDSDAALRQHLLKHANEDVREILQSGENFVSSRPVDVIADLAGGSRRIPNLAVQSSDISDNRNRNLPPGVARILRESANKYEILRRRGVVGGIRNGTVTIQDIETSDQSQPVDENEEGSLIK